MAWSEGPRSWLMRQSDVLAVCVLFAATAMYGTLVVDFRGPPFEDAAMLMRYAENLAGGRGIVWNVGEPPLDGATDFLFMTSAAGLIKLGLSTGRSIRSLGLAAHLFTVILVYIVNRRLWNAGVITSLVSGLYLALATGLWYVAAYFGTPFFALFAAMAWSLGLLLMQTESPRDIQIIGFAVLSLLAALTRPEGAFLAVLMLTSIVIFRGWTRSLRIVAYTAGIMLLGGGLYFAWHWGYFGHPLPNPYYKKGAGLLHWDSLWESFAVLMRFAGPFALAFVIGLRERRVARLTLALALTLLGFAALFVLISNETNFGGRFQYALLPMLLLSYYPLVRGLPADLKLRLPSLKRGASRWAWALTGAALLYALLSYAGSLSCKLTAQQHECGIGYESDGRYDVSRMLADYRGRGYVIATSEAGLLPLYSGWTAIDTWGLNDAFIAREGEVTAEYLDRYRPELIVFHAYYSPLVPPRENSKDLANNWHRMTLVLQQYAESHDYLLAAAFGDSPYESHYYYVRSDFPDAERLTRAIAGLRTYRWFSTGRRAINYAATQP